MQRVTVVGTGFAGLTAVKAIREKRKDIEITVVSPAAEFVYLPSLIWVPSRRRSGDDLRVPLESFFRRMNATHVQAEATGLSDDGRVLETPRGPIENDGLIIASGGRFIKKLPGIEHTITPCEGVAAALRIRERIESMDGGKIAMGFAGNPKEPQAVRGGPIFEFLFGIDSQLRKEKRRDRFGLTFFTPAAQPGNRLGARAVEGIMKEFAKREITPHLGHKITGFSESKVMTEGGDIDADLIVFMPGMTGNHWFDNTTLPRSEGGFVKGDEHCRVPGLERVYVAGDAGSLPGPDWVPKQAHMADLHAHAAAANLIAEFDGGEPSETFRSELICIIDANDRGTLVARTPKRNVVLPPTRAFHWAKRGYEWWYLRQYR